MQLDGALKVISNIRNSRPPLNLLDAQVLLILATNNELMEVGDVARCSGEKIPNVSRSLSRLQRAGLATKSVSTLDQRRVLVVLTAEGTTAATGIRT